MDQYTLTRSVEKLKELYRLEKITVVADRGLNSGKNLEYLCEGGHDFAISYTLKRSPDAFKALVWQSEGWKDRLDPETGNLSFRSKVVDQVLDVKVTADPEEKKKGTPKKYAKKKIPGRVHLTWSAKRAAKDRGNRERILERLKKRLDKPYQLKAAMKRGCNQYMQMELETEDWKLDEAKIEESARYDGYYAIITNNLSLSTDEVIKIYGGLWKVKESFRILKTDLRACPVFVWTDEHIQGHFAFCYVILCLLRYLQYLWNEDHTESISAANLMEAIRDPLALFRENSRTIS